MDSGRPGRLSDLPDAGVRGHDGPEMAREAEGGLAAAGRAVPRAAAVRGEPREELEESRRVVRAIARVVRRLPREVVLEGSHGTLHGARGLDSRLIPPRGRAARRCEQPRPARTGPRPREWPRRGPRAR